MNELDQRNMQQHVPILGWVLIVEHALLLLCGIFVFVLLAGIGVASGDSDAFSFFAVVGLSVGLFLVLLSVPGIAAGVGLLSRRAWSRYLAIAVTALGLLNIPIGTLIGIYALRVLLQQGATEYFA